VKDLSEPREVARFLRHRNRAFWLASFLNCTTTGCGLHKPRFSVQSLALCAAIENWPVWGARTAFEIKR